MIFKKMINFSSSEKLFVTKIIYRNIKIFIEKFLVITYQDG